MAVIINFYVPEHFQKNRTLARPGSAKVIEFPTPVQRQITSTTQLGRISDNQNSTTNEWTNSAVEAKQIILDSTLKALIWPASI